MGKACPATTPEEIHRLFEDAFNAGDIDGLMALYEPDAAVIPQPGSVVHGTQHVRAGLQAFVALQRRITPDTKLVVMVGDLAFPPNTWSLTAPAPTASRSPWAPPRPRWCGGRPTAPGVM
jgi:ketosteroid isomerase-like protein